jgi:beta-glucosidase
MSVKQFPTGFFWGAATASYQVEGGIDNTDWAQGARDGRVPECGQACDHYHRYIQDFDIAKTLGHTAHRLSVEWARIEPEPGSFDKKAIDHYRQVLLALKDRKITPLVTIWHFTVPQWFSESGGFERDDAPEIFARYASYVVQELGDLCQHFSTMNEPNVYGSNGWLRGTWPPFKHFAPIGMVNITNSGRKLANQSYVESGLRPAVLYWRVMKHLAEAHKQAYRAIKEVSPATEVSVVKHMIVFDANWNPFNKLKAVLANYFWTSRFLNRVKGCTDAIGLNYYFYKKFGDKRSWRKTDMDWQFAPEHIYDELMRLRRYQKPIFVSEGGLADADDSDRAEYIQKQVEGVWRAIEAGVDVRGHLYWSLLDNYEWALGYDKRFGLVEINYHTLERKIRPSAYVYKEICETNRVVEYSQ